MPRSLLGGLMSDAMADNAPLWTLTRKSVTADLLKEIAAEYAKGRFLLVATADLDARRAIIWDMGKIATYGTPQALDLFVSIMIASASIPGGFPPVMIDVEVGRQALPGDARGRRHHGAGVHLSRLDPGQRAGDGGRSNARAQALRDSQRQARPGLGADRAQHDEHRRARDRLADPQPGHRRPLPHLSTAQRDGVDFNLTFIPSTFNFPHKEEFDNDYMRKLYDVGYDLAVKGIRWAKVPPGYESAAGK